jgi:hypothetical protein
MPAPSTIASTFTKDINDSPGNLAPTVHGRMARGQWPIRADARDHVEDGASLDSLDAK